MKSVDIPKLAELIGTLREKITGVINSHKDKLAELEKTYRGALELERETFELTERHEKIVMDYKSGLISKDEALRESAPLRQTVESNSSYIFRAKRHYLSAERTVKMLIPRYERLLSLAVRASIRLEELSAEAEEQPSEENGELISRLYECVCSALTLIDRSGVSASELDSLITVFAASLNAS